jgi:hypothetical protein
MYSANVAFNGGSWSVDYWNFGASNSLNINGTGSPCLFFDITASTMPNPYGSNVMIINVPNGVGGTPGRFNSDGILNGNGWTIGMYIGVLGITCYGYQLVHP